MEKLTRFIEDLTRIPASQQIFFISVLAISVSGFSLYVVLEALKNGAGG